jgi:hypothetical protein
MDDISAYNIDRAEIIAEIKHGMFSPQIGLLSTTAKISKVKKDRTPLALESIVQTGTSKKVFEILSQRRGQR